MTRLRLVWSRHKLVQSSEGCDWGELVPVGCDVKSQCRSEWHHEGNDCMLEGRVCDNLMQTSWTVVESYSHAVLGMIWRTAWDDLDKKKITSWPVSSPQTWSGWLEICQSSGHCVSHVTEMICRCVSNSRDCIIFGKVSVIWLSYYNANTLHAAKHLSGAIGRHCLPQEQLADTGFQLGNEGVVRHNKFG